MGYYIKVTDSHFMINIKNLPRFFELVSNLMSDENIEENGNGYSWRNGVKEKSWYSWVNTDETRKAAESGNIEAVFNCWRYEIRPQLTPNLPADDGTYFYTLRLSDGEGKIGDEEKFFAAIAPVVEDDSYLNIRGEDGAAWRWMWKDGKFFVQDVAHVEVTYGEPDEIVFHDVNKATRKELA